MGEKTLRPRLPLPITRQRYYDVARAAVRALGLPWPNDVAPVVTETEGDATTMDEHTTRWSHGDVSIELCHSVDHELRMIESRDRMTSGLIRGLPGCSLVWFSGDHYSRLTEVLVRGEEGVVERVVVAIGNAVAPEVMLVREELALDAWCAGLDDLTAGDGVFRIVPLGPLPRVLERTSMRIERDRAHNPLGAPGPTLRDLVPIFAPVPFFGGPEVEDGSQKRFRIGRWVIREWRSVSGNETTFHLSVQHEQGNPHAAFVGGRFREDGFVELDVLVIGDGERRGEIERRLNAWLARNPRHGWTVKRRDADRAEAPPVVWHDDYAERLGAILRALFATPPTTVGALCELVCDRDGAPGLVSKIRVDGGIDVDPATPLAPGWSIDLRLGREFVRHALVERYGVARAFSTQEEFWTTTGTWIVSWLGPGDTCTFALARQKGPRPDDSKWQAALEQERKEKAARLAATERDAVAAGKEPFDLQSFEQVHNRGSQAQRETDHRWNYALSGPEIRTLADYARYLHALEPWEDSN